jgi:hypothetical protein
MASGAADMALQAAGSRCDDDDESLTTIRGTEPEAAPRTKPCSPT